MVFRPRSVLVRCKMLVIVLRLSIVHVMHVEIVMMAGIGSIIDFIAVVESIVGCFVLHISGPPQIISKQLFW